MVDDTTTMGDAIAIVDMPIACYFYAAAEAESIFDEASSGVRAF